MFGTLLGRLPVALSLALSVIVRGRVAVGIVAAITQLP